MHEIHPARRGETLQQAAHVVAESSRVLMHCTPSLLLTGYCLARGISPCEYDATKACPCGMKQRAQPIKQGRSSIRPFKVQGKHPSQSFTQAPRMKYAGAPGISQLKSPQGSAADTCWPSCSNHERLPGSAELSLGLSAAGRSHPLLQRAAKGRKTRVGFDPRTALQPPGRLPRL